MLPSWALQVCGIGRIRICTLPTFRVHGEVLVGGWMGGPVGGGLRFRCWEPCPEQGARVKDGTRYLGSLAQQCRDSIAALVLFAGLER